MSSSHESREHRGPVTSEQREEHERKKQEHRNTFGMTQLCRKESWSFEDIHVMQWEPPKCGHRDCYYAHETRDCTWPHTNSAPDISQCQIWIGQTYASRLEERLIWCIRNEPLHRQPSWVQAYNWYYRQKCDDSKVLCQRVDFGISELKNEYFRFYGRHPVVHNEALDQAIAARARRMLIRCLHSFDVARAGALADQSETDDQDETLDRAVGGEREPSDVPSQLRTTTACSPPPRSPSPLRFDVDVSGEASPSGHFESTPSPDDQHRMDCPMQLPGRVPDEDVCDIQDGD